MTPNEPIDSESSTEVDMSFDAIWRRLRKVDELNAACSYLSGFTAVDDRKDTPSTEDDG